MNSIFLSLIHLFYRRFFGKNVDFTLKLSQYFFRILKFHLIIIFTYYICCAFIRKKKKKIVQNVCIVNILWCKLSPWVLAIDAAKKQRPKNNVSYITKEEWSCGSSAFYLSNCTIETRSKWKEIVTAFCFFFLFFTLALLISVNTKEETNTCVFRLLTI